MRAIVAVRQGGPDVLELQQVPEPEAGPEGTLVRVHARTNQPAQSGRLEFSRSNRLPVDMEVATAEPFALTGRFKVEESAATEAAPSAVTAAEVAPATEPSATRAPTALAAARRRPQARSTARAVLSPAHAVNSGCRKEGPQQFLGRIR